MHSGMVLYHLLLHCSPKHNDGLLGQVLCWPFVGYVNSRTFHQGHESSNEAEDKHPAFPRFGRPTAEAACTPCWHWNRKYPARNQGFKPSTPTCFQIGSSPTLPQGFLPRCQPANESRSHEYYLAPLCQNIQPLTLVLLSADTPPSARNYRHCRGRSAQIRSPALEIPTFYGPSCSATNCASVTVCCWFCCAARSACEQVQKKPVQRNRSSGLHHEWRPAGGGQAIDLALLSHHHIWMLPAWLSTRT